MFSRNIHTEIVIEGFRDKIFNTEIVTLLVTALGDKDSNVRISMVEIFTAAIAQGSLRCFHGIFVLKQLQMIFGTKYLTLKSMLHLYVH